MTEINLQERFPDLTPISRVPILGQILGCGFRFSGAHHQDPEIPSYVTNYCFCVLTVPLLVLRVYRMIETAEGTIIVGREPVSAQARLWNVLSLAAILLMGGGLWWNQYRQSPEYLARRQISDAAALVEQGKLGDAAIVYRDVANGSTQQRLTAVEKLAELLEGPLQDASAQEAAATLTVVVEMVQAGEQTADQFRPMEHGMRYVLAREAQQPAAALEVLEAISSLAPDLAAILQKSCGLLERLVQLHPGDPDFASRLAVVYEEQGKLEKCEGLLAPHQEKLGTREGARILGQIYARAGKFQEGYPLLSAYAEGRLKQLHEAEKVYESTIEKLQEAAVSKLKNDEAPPSFYRKIQNANEQVRLELINEFIQQQIKEDPLVAKAQKALLLYVRVVPVALDLGMVMIRRARQIEDSQARRHEMERAEQIFVAVRGFAGESSEYRLSLGEIYYWLGKQSEGRELLDEFLKDDGRTHDGLMAVADLLRNLGSVSEARLIVQEAFQTAQYDEQKHAAAMLRAVNPVDLEDEITWLRRANPTAPNTKALLESAEARVAQREGDNEAAASHLRKAIAIYNEQPESTGTLNNAALMYERLFQVTGELDALENHSKLMERAIQLDPSDGIILKNAANAAVTTALNGIVGDTLDLKTLKMPGSLELVDFLFTDSAGREQYVERVRSHQQVKKAVGWLDQAQLVSPRSWDNYQQSATLHRFMRDANALRGLLARIDEANPDTQDQGDFLNAFRAGEKDEEFRKASANAIAELTRTLDLLSSQRRGATFAVAASTMCTQMMTAAAVGLEVNDDNVVRFAEEAYAAVPSVATRNHLVLALFFRASRARALQDAQYAKLFAAARREVSHASLLGFAISIDAGARQELLVNPDITRAIDLIGEAAVADPDGCGAWDWDMLRLRHSDKAEQLASHVRQNEASDLKYRIDGELEHDRSLRSVLQAYHTAKFKEDPAAAELALAEIGKRLPLAE